MWSWSVFFLGLGLGLLLTIPIAFVWSRRTAKRVRELELRARSAERLAELGTMTSGLAHEIKNPLSTIGLNMQLLREDLGELKADLPAEAQPEEKMRRIQRRFDSLHRETQHLREILEDFLRFAGRVELDLKPRDLNDVVDELADFYEPQAQAADVQIRTQLLNEPAMVSADASLLKQALLNLLINASHAMSEARQQSQAHGGADELILRLSRERPVGRDEIHIHVIDTGPGIAEEVREKIFQPYFSTKRGGTGLGLATARRIIEEHGGHLTVHSAHGRGTDFTVALPMQRREEA